MGFRYKDDVIATIEGHQIAGAGPQDEIAWEYGSFSSWVQAFPSTDRARFASDGLRRTINVLREPGINFLDYLVPNYIYDRWGNGRPAAVYGTHFDAYTPPVALGGSGDKVLRLLPSAFSSSKGLVSELPFRVASGQTYRMTLRWACDSTSATTPAIEVSALEVENDLGPGPLSGQIPRTTSQFASANVLQYDSVVFAAGAESSFFTILIDTDPADTRTYYLDELLIEPIGGFEHRTSNNGQSIANAGAVVNFEDTSSSSSDFTYSAGTFTCVRPGDYTITGVVHYANLADQVSYGCFIRVNGANANVTQLAQSGTSVVGATCTATRRLARGDTVAIFAYQLAGVAETLHTDGAYNYVTIKRID